MKYKYNPFKPNSPVFKGMFVGREYEIERTDEILFHTKYGNPTNILIIGERGIGKSSLLLVANYFSKGDLNLSDNIHNFLTVQISLNKDMTLPDFAKKLKNVIERELRRLNKGLSFIKKTWSFIQRIEIAGSGLKQSSNTDNGIEIFDNLIYSIVDTVKALTSQDAISEIGLKKQKEGLVILIDEADSASKELNLGMFIKNLSETLVLENCNKVLFILAGLPNICDILLESHESSLRLFEQFELTPLSQKEVTQVALKGIQEYNEKKPENKLTIDDKAYNRIYFFSEGYPHFVQQICYSTLSIDDDNHISIEDVENGFGNKGGAVDLIGDRYYKNLFFNKINVDSYRQILRIMAKKWNSWVSKEEIRQEFKGKASTLDNGIKALRDRNIILSKKGARGLYRLQWASFAFWIRTYSKYIEQI
ncbi:MAG: AAA family ATPase [Candidatus Lokiarchaeota archaeon]|nr:AAA family ATPase [Candidatus Lokiarchaeota archaeon]